jgi:hypothetical protein
VKDHGEFELFVIPESGRQLNPDVGCSLRSGQRNLEETDLRKSHFFKVGSQVLVGVDPGHKLEKIEKQTLKDQI